MNKFLIFTAVIGAAYAGSRNLSPSESVPKLAEFNRLCESGRISENGALVNLDGEKTWVYCKRSGGTTVVENTEEKTFDVDEPPPQAVFVKPSDISLKQKVLVSGTVKAPRTKIFYVPPKVDTTVDVDVQSQTERPNKPTVYFLSKNEESTSDSDSQPSPPGGLYLPPRGSSRVSEDYAGASSALSPEVVTAPRKNDQDDSSFSSQEESPDYGDAGPAGTAEIEEDPVSRHHNKREIDDTVSPIIHMFKVNGDDGKPRLIFLRKKY